MMNIKACIFDLDGVIVDTAKYHFMAWHNLAKMMGFEFTEAHNERLKGISRMASLDILLEVGGLSFDLQTRLELAEFKNTEYVGYIEKMTPDEILPGVNNFLLELKQNGIKTAIGSASKNTPLILERTGIRHLFDAVIDGNLVSEAKPNPEVFLKGAQALGVEPNACVVFEDAEAGIDAAVAGGMRSVGIGNPHVLNKADYVMHGFAIFTVEQLKAIFSEKQIA
jgi:beta-phosphoglucomutase